MLSSVMKMHIGQRVGLKSLDIVSCLPARPSGRAIFEKSAGNSRLSKRKTYGAEELGARASWARMAQEGVSKTEASVMLIVGGRNHQVQELRRSAAAQLAFANRIEIVHEVALEFEEPGPIEQDVDPDRPKFETHLSIPETTP